LCSTFDVDGKLFSVYRSLEVNLTVGPFLQNILQRADCFRDSGCLTADEIQEILLKPNKLGSVNTFER
jgi:hypothetical protein